MYAALIWSSFSLCHFIWWDRQTSPSPGTCYHNSFFLVHVQGQVGVLVHMAFVLPYTLSGPQVPQLDL